MARWITFLGGFKMRIEHRVQEKHFNADGMSKKIEFYEGREKSDLKKPKSALSFLDKMSMILWRPFLGWTKMAENSVSKKRLTAMKGLRIESRLPSLSFLMILTILIITRDLTPSFPVVVRNEEIVVELEFQAIKMITPNNSNADEQFKEIAKAMKLISAVTYSLSDLQIAQRTNLVTLALLKLCAKPRIREVAGAALGS